MTAAALEDLRALVVLTLEADPAVQCVVADEADSHFFPAFVHYADGSARGYAVFPKALQALPIARWGDELARFSVPVALQENGDYYFPTCDGEDD